MFCRDNQESDHTDQYRQQYSSGIHKKARGSAVTNIVSSDAAALSFFGEEQYNCEGEIHSRKAKCDSRSAIETRRSIANRVVNQFSDSGQSVDLVGETNGRFVCHEVQQKDGNLCFTGTGSGSIGYRRDDDELGGVGSVCISAHSYSGSGITEGTRGQVSDGSHSSVLAEPSLVSNDSGTIDRSTLSSSMHQDNAETATVVEFSQRTGNLQPTCLEIISKRLQQKGFSGRVAERISQPVKVSSGKVYQSKWSGFCSWCQGRKIDLEQTTVPEIADFFNHLFEEKKLAISTIEGYRTAINKVISVTQGVNIGTDINLSHLFKNMEREVPRSISLVPKWDLAQVLKALTEAPFEPLRKASLKHVTHKT